MHMTSDNNMRNFNKTEAGRDLSQENKSQVDDEIKNMQIKSHDFIPRDDDEQRINDDGTENNYGIPAHKQTISSRKSNNVVATKSVDLNSNKSKVNSNS